MRRGSSCRERHSGAESGAENEPRRVCRKFKLYSIYGYVQNAASEILPIFPEVIIYSKNYRCVRIEVNIKYSRNKSRIGEINIRPNPKSVERIVNVKPYGKT